MSYKILILHNILWSFYKGAVFTELGKLLEQEKIEYFVIQIANTEKQRKKLGSAVDRSVHNYSYKVLFNKSFEEIWATQRTFKILKEIISYKPNLITIPGYNDISYVISMLLAKMLGKKIIMKIDSTEMDKPRKWYKELIKKLILKLGDAFWCYGTASEMYLKKLGVKGEKIFIGCQAIKNDEIESAFRKIYEKREDLKIEYGFDKQNFIYVGRLSPEKNLTNLIRAFSLIKKESKKAKEWGLILVGDGKEKTNLKKLVRELNLKDVYFVGGKFWKEVVQYYALADVFILPSISEAWGLVVNEAMICGLPVIVSNRCGSAYDLVLEGENGFTFDPFNVEELVNIMLKFVNEEVDIKEMGAKSKEIIREYTPENAAKQMFTGIKFVLGME